MEKCSKGRSLFDQMFREDPWLAPFAGIIQDRHEAIQKKQAVIVRMGGGSLADFADYHLHLGIHRCPDGWVIREWAPNAREILILCEATGWVPGDVRLEQKKDGIFEGIFPEKMFSHGDLLRFRVRWPGGEGDRIPTAAQRVVQDPHTLIFNAQVWAPEQPFQWRFKTPDLSGEPVLIYEAHVGMALEDGRVGTFREFENHILPKIKDAGYNTLQLMAIQEHPYYGSFGYHVSSFFAPSSRFGTPEELKSLVDSAHGMGLRVLIDIIHSHGVKNEVEGLSRFDGTLHQFFHDGPRGLHRLWDSRCFNYAVPQVIRFLLSNLKYWLDAFHVDGFRFDGITSMLFEDHGLGRAFVSYDDYFGPDVDTDALAYLRMAGDLVHAIRPDAVMIAEDVSGYPGLAAPSGSGGFGFDYRFAMGIADFWIRLLKEYRDEDWPMGRLWYELTTRRAEEKTISYAECHDQALVGDKTLMMQLMGEKIYTEMGRETAGIETHRAVALHKMIRLVTLCTAHSGYLNFMGNEFGHPEWIDFPSRMNGFSFHYARRQWSLKYDQRLLYSDLFSFDREMIRFVRKNHVFSGSLPRLLHLHEDDNVLAFERSSIVFVFNFHPVRSFTDYLLPAAPGKYRLAFDTDAPMFGGHGRLQPEETHFTLFDPEKAESGNRLSLYLPSRSAQIFTPAV